MQVATRRMDDVVRDQLMTRNGSNVMDLPSSDSTIEYCWLPVVPRASMRPAQYAPFGSV